MRKTYILSDLPPDVIANVSEYLEGAISFFALRASCKAFRNAISDVAPVFPSSFKNLVKPDNRRSRRLRLLGDPFSTDVFTALSSLTEWPERARQWRLMLAERPIGSACKLSPSVAERVLLYSWCLGDVDLFRKACEIPRCRAYWDSLLHLPDVCPVNSLEMLKMFVRWTGALTMEEKDILICQMARGGRIDCVEYLLNLFRRRLRDVAGIRKSVALGGEMALAERLLAEGAYTGQRLRYDIEEAIKSGNPRMVEFLLKLQMTRKRPYMLSREAGEYSVLFELVCVDPRFSSRIPNPEIAQIIFNYKCDESRHCASGDLLRIAAGHGWIEICSVFVRNGIEPHLSHGFNTPFNKEMAEFFFKVVPETKRSEQLGHAVISAAREHSVDGLKYLLEKGANLLECRTSSGENALLVAMGRSRAKQCGMKSVPCGLRQKRETIEFILGVCPVLAITAEQDGSLPMRRALSNWRWDPVSKDCLIAFGADRRQTYSRTALLAPYSISVSDLHERIKGGADITASMNGITVLDVFCRSGNLEVVLELLKMGLPLPSLPHIIRVCGASMDARVLDILVTAGSDVNKPDEQGNFPLATAIQAGCSPAVIRSLLRRGADVSQRCPELKTPLAQLLEIQPDGFEQLADMILARNADINVTDMDGSTLLLQAAENKRWGAVEWLIANNAQQHIANQLGICFDPDKLPTSRTVADTPIAKGKKAAKIDVDACVVSGDVLKLRLALRQGQQPPGFRSVIGRCHRHSQAAIFEAMFAEGHRLPASKTAHLIKALKNECGADVIQVLVKNGVDLNATEKDGITPLQFCLHRPQLVNRSFYIKLFLQHGAIVSPTDAKREDMRTLMSRAGRGSENMNPNLNRVDGGCEPLKQ